MLHACKAMPLESVLGPKEWFDLASPSKKLYSWAIRRKSRLPEGEREDLQLRMSQTERNSQRRFVDDTGYPRSVIFPTQMVVVATD